MQYWKLILIDFSFIISQNFNNLITVQFQLVECTQYGHDNDTYVSCFQHLSRVQVLQWRKKVLYKLKSRLNFYQWFSSIAIKPYIPTEIYLKYEYNWNIIVSFFKAINN